MNRFVQKLIAGAAAVAIAVTGLVGGAPVAKADPKQPTDGTITITNVAGDTAEHTLSGWKLASLRNVSSDNGQLNFLIDTNNDMVSVIEDSMTKDQLDKYHKDANYYTDAGTENNPIGWLVANDFKGSSESNNPWGGDSSELRTFATKLSKKLADGNAPDADKTDFKSSADGSVSNSCAQGLWLLKDVSDEPTTQSIPIIVATALKEYSTETANWGSVTLKMDVPTVDKKITSSATGTVAKDGANADARIGDVVNYELSSVIPTYTGYDITKPPRVFKLIDTASKGQTVTADSVKSVTLKKKGQDNVVLVKGTDYTVATAGYNGTDSEYTGGIVTTIDLDKYVNKAAGSTSSTAGILEGATVTVEFEATVNSSAVKTGVGNPNSVELEYSRTPENVSTKIPGPEVRVYTYEFGILKTDMAGNAIQSSKDLKGAQFVIARVNGGSAETFMAKDATSGAWSDLAAKPAVDATTGVFTTDANGKIAMSGLPAGEYRVYEIKAPTGYTNIGLPDFKFTISATFSGTPESATVSYTKDTGDERISVGANDGKATVKNAKNLTELPMTGDLGIKVFITVGVLLMAAGAAFALSARMRA